MDLDKRKWTHRTETEKKAWSRMAFEQFVRAKAPCDQWEYFCHGRWPKWNVRNEVVNWSIYMLSRCVIDDYERIVDAWIRFGRAQSDKKLKSEKDSGELRLLDLA